MSEITTWATTADANSASSPDGFPEGWPVTAVTPSFRELMAAVKRQDLDMMTSFWVGANSITGGERGAQGLNNGEARIVLIRNTTGETYWTNDLRAITGPITLPGAAKIPYDIAWNGTRFVAVAADGHIYYSTTGESASWTEVVAWDYAVTTAAFRVVTVNSNNRFIAIGDVDGPTTRAIFAYSADGITWTSQILGSPILVTNYAVRAACALGANFYVEDSQGSIYKSTDNGVTWTGIGALPVVEGMNYMCSHGTILVAVGNTGQVFTSSDSGVNWTARASGVTDNLNHVISFSGGEGLLCVGDNGVILTSYDSGVTWKKLNETPSVPIVGAFEVNAATRYLVVGLQGIYPYYGMRR